MLAAERLSSAISRGRPIGGLFEHVDNGQGFRAGGPHQDSVAGLADFADAAPTVNGRRYSLANSVHYENCRKKCKRGADDDPLHDTGT